MAEEQAEIPSPAKTETADSEEDKVSEVKESRSKPTLGAIGRRTSVGGPIEQRKYVMSTERCGDIHVHVQGDISQQDKRAVFLTVHDLGCNHHSFLEFVNHPSMTDIRDRSVFIHVDAPGHEDNAEALPDSFEFPTLQQFGEDLITVLNRLHVKYVVGFGEGAGANVCARFALAHPSRVLGLILINCTASAAGLIDAFKNKFVNWRGNNLVSQSAEDYLLFHKFGNTTAEPNNERRKSSTSSIENEEVEQILNDNQRDKDRVMAEYQSRIRTTINSRNLKLYVNAFLTRKDLPLKTSQTDILLVTGVLSSYSSFVEKLYKDMPDKSKATLLRIERAGDVLLDAPMKVAHAMLLFLKGLGLLTSVAMPGLDNSRTRRASQSSFESGDNLPSVQPRGPGLGGGRRLSRGMSMEDYDKPNIRRLSLTTAPDNK